jgi:hypothetical protein
MNLKVANGNVVLSAKTSQNQVRNKSIVLNITKGYFNLQSKNALDPISRPSSTSGFQSFLRWFKKDIKSSDSKNLAYPREITSSSETLEDVDRSDRSEQISFNRALKNYDSSDTLSPPSSPKLGYSESQSSSDCDSIFSTATSSFAFVQPKIYQPNGNSNKVN